MHIIWKSEKNERNLSRHSKWMVQVHRKGVLQGEFTKGQPSRCRSPRASLIKCSQ